MYTHNPAPLSVFLFYLHPHISNSCVYVSNHVYAFPSPPLIIRMGITNWTPLHNSYQPPILHPLASFHNGLGCTLPLHPTSHALSTSPTPRKRELVCGACIGTTQVPWLHPWIHSSNSLRFLRDMIIHRFTLETVYVTLFR